MNRRRLPLELASDARTGLTAQRRRLLPPAFVRAAEPTELFRTKAEAAGVPTLQLASLEQLPEAVRRHLTPHERGLPFFLQSGTALQSLAWADSGLDLAAGRPELLAEQVVLSEALAGVAETGSVVLSSRRPGGVLANLLAEHHLVVLPESRIVPTVESAWSQVRNGDLPASLAFVTGPSKTGDIDQTLELGAHGPSSLTVFLIEDSRRERGN